MTGSPETAAFAGLLCLLAGLLVPALVRRIPEPGLDGESDGEPEVGEVKESYADLAALPGLAVRSAGASGLAGSLVGLALGWDWALLFLLPLVPVSVALAVVDWRTRLLPTRVIAPAYVVTVALVLACWVLTRETDDLVRAGYGWLVAGGLFFVLWFVHPRGLGYGDVRLAGLLGIALGQLGWAQLAVGVYGAFLLGGVGGGLLSLLRVVERRAFPFGPFMLVAALVGVVAGEDIAGLVTG